MRYATIIASVLFAVTFVWGVVHFPDAPIRPCGVEFCGKYGAIHPQATYEEYVWWSRIVIALFFLTFAALFAWNMQQPERSGSE